MTHRILVPSTALLWGLQIAFLNPALALILTALFGASTTELGWALALYNTSGLIASLVVPARADRTGDYLRPMLVSGGLSIALALVLVLTSSLQVAVAALIVLGGPAGLGSTLLFAHLRHAGATPTQIVDTRAIVSVAWVGGPPLAALVIGSFGESGVLWVIALVAALGMGATALLARSSRTATPVKDTGTEGDHVALSRRAVVLIIAAFVLLQATNATATAYLTVYVTRQLELDVLWAGIALGVAAGLEVPALLLIGRLGSRFSDVGLIVSGCLAGIAYYLLLAGVTTPGPLIAIQVLNAWSFAAVAGTGLSLFQRIIAGPGLATGMYMNTRRVGAILSGPVIAIGASTPLGSPGIFVACAALMVLGLTATVLAHVIGRRGTER
ncbi:MFS transporter [Promicromonospora sukumoe]|uniref:MFS transporter n=1 Tax=Promicromonospora sukumoe TaxID=88382 RepID=UPI0037C521C6